MRSAFAPSRVVMHRPPCTLAGDHDDDNDNERTAVRSHLLCELTRRSKVVIRSVSARRIGQYHQLL